MTYADMVGFFTEDLVMDARPMRASRSVPFREEGYSVCPCCGMEIIFEVNHPEFCHCPECGGELIK